MEFRVSSAASFFQNTEHGFGNVCQGSTEFCSALLTTYEWRQLSELLAVLEPFSEATLNTQGVKS